MAKKTPDPAPARSPSKMTKTDLRKEIQDADHTIEVLNRKIERLEKTVKVRENNLHAEIRAANDIRKERDRYQKRFGDFADSTLVIEIAVQTVVPKDYARAKEIAHSLIDLGVWHFRAGEIR